jgi:tetratricopeptide (TPR) repeat protein
MWPSQLLEALPEARDTKSEAARLLGMQRSTFFNRLKKYGLLDPTAPVERKLRWLRLLEIIMPAWHTKPCPGLTAIVWLIAASAVGPLESRAAEGRIDGDHWAQRNVELIRKELGRPADDKSVARLTVLSFSIQFNPLLLRDPYAAEVAGLAEAYIPQAGENADVIRRIVALFRKPLAERVTMGRDEIAAALDPDQARPDKKPDQLEPGSIAERIMRLPADQRAAREPAFIAEMEAAARDPRGWGRLGLSYLHLARDATKEGDRARADRYVNRLLAILREHPEFQDPARGNTDAVDPTSLARFFFGANRREQWDAYLQGQKGDVRADLAIGAAGSLGYQGDFDAARVIVDRHVQPIRPDSAARLLAAIRGEIILPPPRPTGPGLPGLSPEEKRLREAQKRFAYGQAVRGDVEKAGRMQIALERDDRYHLAGEGRLAAHEWSRFAMLAAEHRHFEAARRGFDLANDAMQYDVLLDRARRDEKARLVREAVGLGQYEIADSMHQTGSEPGAWTRLSLAKVYRERGDAAKAAALLDEGLAIGNQPNTKEGASMAWIAVELQRMGQPDRAERAFLDSLARIHGEDFGFSGTSSVVEAAVALNRVDLLDRLYDRSDAGDRLLLCIMASRLSMVTPAQPK